MKTGEVLKGLIVEEHEDRLIMSTEKGEVPVLRIAIQDVEYDDPAQNFLQAGRAYEEKKRWGEALAYYEKALQLNPDLEDAKKASVRVRNLFWAQSATGPVAEIERRQALYETWDKKRFTEKNSAAVKTPQQLVAESLGVTLVQKDDWVRLAEVSPKKDAALAGLRAGDRLVAIDGDSLRYLSAEAVRPKFVSPRYSSFTLEYDRDCRLMKSNFEKETRDFGFELKLENQGIRVAHVSRGSAADRAGLKIGDLLVGVNGGTTRYLPLKKFMATLQKSQPATYAVLTVRRSVLLARR